MEEIIELLEENRALKAEITRLNAVIAKMQPQVELLEALRQVGVDNWNGYSDAHRLLEDNDE